MTRIQNGSLTAFVNSVPSGILDTGYLDMSYTSPPYDIDPRRGTFTFYDSMTSYCLCPVPPPEARSCWCGRNRQEEIGPLST